MLYNPRTEFDKINKQQTNLGQLFDFRRFQHEHIMENILITVNVRNMLNVEWNILRVVLVLKKSLMNL